MPTRLVAILLIPVVIGLVFGGLRVNGSIDSWQSANRAEKTARLAAAATGLADALEQERDLSAVPILTDEGKSKVTELREATDKAVDAYEQAYRPLSDDPRLARRNTAFQDLLVSLPSLRENAYSPRLFPTATQNAYSTLIAPLMAYENEVGFGSSSVTSRGRAIYAMTLAKASASTQRVLMTQLLLGSGTLTAPEVGSMVQAIAVSGKLEEVSLDEFRSGTTDADMTLYQNALKQEAATAVRQGGEPNTPVNQQIRIALSAVQTAAATGTKSGAKQALAAAGRQGVSLENWLAATGAHVQTYRTVENRFNELVLADAHRIKVGAQHDAILNSAIVLAALAVAGLLTGFIARSMIIGMRTLRAAALDIAGHRLPDLVDRLSKTDPDRVDTTVQPIPLHGRDEIGEVARAFDEVHREAVRLAAEQALLRGNVNAIFTNLSRRSQGLIQRQLALITDLENNENDPEQLENLFKLDHLATRMRRNGENLLVLAGEDPGRHWNQPVPLVDVLRAAASEVEQYDRIELSGIPEAEVVGIAVTDLVHLLAELLENATTFSSPQTRVQVTATRLPDGRVLVEIHDKGIGLTVEDFAEINQKLAHPPTVDATISRRMGLFVVGRLADRHDIRVQLRPTGESAGTTSLVMLPAALIKPGGVPEQPAEEQFTVSRIFVEQSPDDDSFERLRSAAELGFDESRFERPEGPRAPGGFSPALDSMNRSRRLEQRRRAALEAGPSTAAPVQPPTAPEPAAAAPQPAAEPVAPVADDFPAPQDYLEQGYDGKGAEPPYAEPEFGGQQYAAPRYEQAQYEQDQYAETQYEAPQYGDQPYRSDQYATARYPDGEQAPQGFPQGDHQQPGYQQDGYREPFPGAPQQEYAEEFPADPYAGAPYGGVGQFSGPVRPGYDHGAAAADGYQATPPTPPPPPAPTPAAHTSAGLPQRRPGQALPGGGGAAAGGLGNRAIGGLESGERPNWFTGAREAAAPADAPGAPSVPGGPSAGGPSAGSPSAGSPVAGGPTSAPAGGPWQRPEQSADPGAGGTTASGLPRRVPKQNLGTGNAPAGPQDGPQISRAPEEVRGRLTNLRRGVQQGRSAGGDPSVTGGFRVDQDGNEQHGSTDLFGGSNHQER
ncbi:nitrate- and nitrite sensing domain-containing protein [Streptomyces sp. NPDC092296]|uniref:sensor histidine kinase n=1 Tax=Streptomyces sp. NPDC092296 TaxID=3366012 RepID=UPI00382C5AFA